MGSSTILLLITTSIICALIVGISLNFVILGLYTKTLRQRNKEHRHKIFDTLGISPSEYKDKRIVGFFHPYCNAGGGGERVLWAAITAIQRSEPNVINVVYTGDVDATKESIISKVKARFDISLDPAKLYFVFLQRRDLVEDSAWPRFTLLGQSIGSMYLAWEAMTQLIPDLFIDSMGYAFTFYVVSIIGRVPIGAYVHYPTISTEMLHRVRTRRRWHTNSDAISSSPVLSQVKLFYYRIFMYYYSLSLRTASFVMVNSSWTKGHVDSILGHKDLLIDLLHMSAMPVILVFSLFFSGPRLDVTPRSLIVFPSCDTRAMNTFALNGRDKFILSIAQFRPEKDHAAQLESFHIFLRESTLGQSKQCKLILIGGSRNDDDAARVKALKNQCKELGIEDHVEFIVNAPYSTVLEWLSRASIGLNTMVDEHFGINVVEYMAAGAIPVAHASGGPLKDIVIPVDGKPTGYHADSPKGFAEAFEKAFDLSSEEDMAMRERARSHAVSRFSEEEFEKGWNASGWKKFLSQ